MEASAVAKRTFVTEDGIIKDVVGIYFNFYAPLCDRRTGQ